MTQYLFSPPAVPSLQAHGLTHSPSTAERHGPMSSASKDHQYAASPRPMRQ